MPGWIPPRLRDLLGADLDSIEVDALERLIGLAESVDLDWKLEMYETTTGGRKEFAYDVAGMANASGGLLLIGVVEGEEAEAIEMRGVETTFDVGEWCAQVITERISPKPVFEYASVSVSGSDRIHIVAIPPSKVRPHAVSIGGGGLRYPVRIGQTRGWLHEVEVADLYRRRNLEAAADRDELKRISSIALARSSRHPRTMGWLLVSLVPTFAGDLRLSSETPRQYSEDVLTVLRSFPSQADRRIPDVGVGFRAIKVQNDNFMIGELFSDGGGFLGFAYAPRERHVQIFDEILLADVINGCLCLARHALATGASGEALLNAELSSTPLAMTLEQARAVLPGQLRGTRELAADEPCFSRHSAPLELLSVPGPELVTFSKLIVSDLSSAFGLAEPQQIREGPTLIRNRFAQGVGDRVEAWAARADVNFENE